MSLYFLEPPYPEELFFSVAARTRRAMRNNSSRQFFVELTGSPRIDVDLGVGFAARQCDFIEDASTFQRTSMLGFLQSFMAVPLKRVRLAEAITGGDASRANYLIGRAGTRRRAEPYLRYCPQCVRDQRKEFGEAYWTRLPQIVGLVYCPIHKTPFCSSKVARYRPEELVCFEDADLYPKGQPIFLEKKEVLVDLAEEVAELFDFIPPWDSPRLNRAWQEVFHAANFRPRVHGAARLLANRLDARYGPKFLAWALCPTDGDAKDNWIVKFVRNPAKEADPLRHLVVLHAIGHKLSELVEYGSNILSHPRVDDSKLKCVNPICGCFGQAYRKQTHIFRHPHLREEVAHHTCLTCYQTVEQRLLPARQGEPVRIVDRGELWSNELSRLWQDPKLSIRQIGKRLGAESLTIKRHAVKAGLAFPRKGLRISRKKPRVGQVKPRPSQGMYAEKRQGWLKVLKSQKSLSAARRKVPAIYAWLRRNDRDWMIAHRPARILLSSQGACRVDWKAREQGFIRQVDAARAAMLTCCPPRFISATALLRKIGAGRSTSALKRMPELLQTASAMSETRVAFALRRIAFVQTRLPKGFTRQDLIDASSIRRQLSKNEEVMRLVDEVLRAA